MYLSATFGSQYFRFLWFMPSLGIRSLCIKQFSNDFIIRGQKNCWQPELSGNTIQQNTISTNVKTLSYFCLQDPTRRPPVSPLVPLMRPEEERCSSLIVHSIKRWNGKIPSRLFYLDKKSFFCWQKINSYNLLSCTHHMV